MPLPRPCINNESGCKRWVVYPETMCPDCQEAARLLSQTIEIENEQRNQEED